MTLVIALNVAFWWPLIGLVLGPLPSIIVRKSKYMGNLHQELRVTQRLSSRSSKKKKEWRKKYETHRSRSHVHGRSTVMVKEEEGVEDECSRSRTFTVEARSPSRSWSKKKKEWRKCSVRSAVLWALSDSYSSSIALFNK